MMTNLEILIARRDELRALTYKTDTITAELERLHRLIERATLLNSTVDTARQCL